MASCFFIGHREAEDWILPRITETAERLIQQEQVTVFYVGKYGRFDILAGKAILFLKKKYPCLRLYLVIPYHPANKPVETPKGYDGTFYPDGMEAVPQRFAIYRANQKMIDSCDFLMQGRPIQNATTDEARQNGFALITEERRATGIFGENTILFNSIIANVDAYGKPLLSSRKMDKDTDWVIDSMPVD